MRAEPTPSRGAEGLLAVLLDALTHDEDADVRAWAARLRESADQPNKERKERTSVSADTQSRAG